MKNVMIAIVVLFAGLSAAQAQETPSPAPEQSVPSMQDDKVRIQPEDLPESVQNAIENEGDDASYAGWQIDEVFHYTKTDVYEVRLTQGAESKILKFDAEGNVIEEDSDE